MERIVGLVLLALGLSWLILSVLNFTITETVIDTAFALEAGETYGPWEKGTEYWTRGLPVLTGKVSVEGEGINFTFQGAMGEFQRVFVDSYFNFTIDPAGADCYWFTFDNTRGNSTSHVGFVLNETLTESLTFRLIVTYWRSADLWIFSLLGAFVLLPIGFILTLGVYSQRKRKKPFSLCVHRNSI